VYHRVVINCVLSCGYKLCIIVWLSIVYHRVVINFNHPRKPTSLEAQGF
jgi:hypothetical protein